MSRRSVRVVMSLGSVNQKGNECNADCDHARRDWFVAMHCAVFAHLKALHAFKDVNSFFKMKDVFVINYFVLIFF